MAEMCVCEGQAAPVCPRLKDILLCLCTANPDLLSTFCSQIKNSSPIEPSCLTCSATKGVNALIGFPGQILRTQRVIGFNVRL